LNINSNSPRNSNLRPIPRYMHECYSLWVVMFHHRNFFHRLSL
jgi:hypothetical protein